MADNEVIYIAMNPPPDQDDLLVKNIAGIIGKSVYDTRLAIAGEIPRIIAHFDNMPFAEEIAVRLRDLGLETMMLREPELRQPKPPFYANLLEFKNDGVIFRNNQGNEINIKTNDVSLIIKGKLQTSAAIETTQSKKKINIAGTLLTGGIPIYRRVDEKSTSQIVQDEYFIRLFTRTAPESCIEIRQKTMNYSFFEKKMAASSLANFDNLSPMLKELFTKAVFDERLIKSYMPSIHSNRIDDYIEVKCRLIYLFNSITK
jgi:hypothetical protein